MVNCRFTTQRACKRRTHLLLHKVLEVCDPLRVLRVAADVVLVEEGLRQKKNGKEKGCGGD